MSDYQEALAAARIIVAADEAALDKVLDSREVTHYESQAIRYAGLVARMLLKNHDISHGEKPK